MENTNPKGYKFFLLKAYFDKGFGFLSYVKYIILLLGVDRVIAGDIKMMILLSIGYMILCFIIGFVMYHYNFILAEKEVSNRYDPFIKEMRKTKLLNTRKK